MKKINGFTRQPHILQMLSYVIFFGNILIYSFIIFPMSNTLERIISAILFYAISLIVIFSGVKTTSIDPTDDVVIEERECRLQNKIFDNSKYEYFCNTCDTHVHEDSKHCKQCERCVQKFDHHCKWVNNCIGYKNYGHFLILIIAVMFSSAIFSIFSLILTLEYKSDETNFLDKRAEFFEKNEKIVGGLMIVLWFFTGLTIILAVLDSNLVFFHLWLIKNKLTTYEYILRRREKSGKKIDRKKFLKRVEKKQQRNSIQNENETELKTSSPKFTSNTSNPPITSANNLNLDKINPSRKTDWKEKLFTLFNKPLKKKNKVFTETSRNTELVQNDIHNDDENLIPKISGFFVETAGCNAEEDAKMLEENNQTSNREEIASCGNEINEMAHKNGGFQSLNPLALDEKLTFLTASPNERSNNELAITKEQSKETAEKEGSLRQNNNLIKN